MRGMLALILVLAGCDTADHLHRPRPAAFQPAPGAAMMFAAVPARDRAAPIAVEGARGDLVSWRTADNVGFTFDRGVLVATRGLGPDLMAGDAAPTLAALAQPGGPAYPVRKRYLTGDDRDRILTLTCRMEPPVEDAGAQLYRESCALPDGAVVQNRFVFARDGSLLRSEQWIGPDLGLALFAALAGQAPRFDGSGL